MNGRYNYPNFRPRGPVNVRGGSNSKSGSNTGLIIGIFVGFLMSAGAALYFMKKGTGQDMTAAPMTASQIAALQATTNPPATSAPLCPNNYAPVVDRFGKIFQNACYADSVGAQYAPVPYTTVPTAPGIDPTTAALLARIPGGSNIAAGAVARVTRVPVTINQGAQKIGGGSFTQGAATFAPVRK